jgi:mono/diheme cytochrome c family protein
MIKSTLTLSSLAVIFLLSVLTSCKKETTVTPTTTVAFEHATIKPFFDTNCASCHATGKINANKWLYNPADYASSIKGYITSIYKDVYTTKSMPQGATLSAAQLTSFKTWYDAGYPAK